MAFISQPDLLFSNARIFFQIFWDGVEEFMELMKLHQDALLAERRMN